jgi:hypothetical protein
MAGSHRSHRLIRAGLLVTLAVVGACASQQEPQERARVKESIDQILSQPLSEEEYVKPRRCISQFAYRDFEPLGDRYLLFKGTGNKLWLNELKGTCPGLHRSTALAFDLHGSQICELDRFKVSDWFEWAHYRRWPWHWLDGVPCTLGKFQPITAEQLEAVRATLKSK